MCLSFTACTVKTANVSVCALDDDDITFKEKTMKKIVSAMALCVVLFGTIMMVTGCGNKPTKGSVWKVTKIAGVDVPASVDMYFCFHSNGNAYMATKKANVLGAEKMGTYTIGKKDITVKNGSVTVTWPYTSKGEKMTLKGNFDGKDQEMELQKVTSPTQDEIAKVAK